MQKNCASPIEQVIELLTGFLELVVGRTGAIWCPGRARLHPRENGAEDRLRWSLSGEKLFSVHFMESGRTPHTYARMLYDRRCNRCAYPFQKTWFVLQKLRFLGKFSFWFQGTLVALAALSEGKLVDKLQSAALLSPIAYLSHMTTPLGVVATKSFSGEVSR